MKKTISLFLALLFLATSLVLPVSAEDDTLTVRVVGVMNPEINYGPCAIYEDAQGRVFMDLRDVAWYTRSTVTQINGNPALTHAARNIELNVAKGELVENGRKKSLDMRYYEDLVLVHAAPLLTYLGASCDFYQNMLLIATPTYTLWEAVEATGKENYITLEEAFGSKGKVMARLFINGVLKFLDSGIVAAMNVEYRSLLLALQLDPSAYDQYLNAKSVQDLKDAMFLESTQLTGASLEELQQKLKHHKSFHKLYSSFQDFRDLWVVDEVKEANKSFLGGVSATFMSTLASVIQHTKTAQDSYDIVLAAAKHMSKDARFHNNLVYAQTALKDTQSGVVASLSHHVVLEEVFKNNCVDVIAKLIDDHYKASVHEIDIYGLNKSIKPTVTQMVKASVDISLIFNKIFCGAGGVIATTTAETNCIELLRLKQDLQNTMSTLAKKIIAADYSNAADLEDYRLLTVFYYRTLIAMNEQFEAMILAQKDKRDREDMQQLITTLREHSNLFAEKLYMLTLADTSPLADVEALASDNAWDGKVPPDNIPEEDDTDEILPPENCESYWSFDFDDEHPALMHVYCDDNGRIELIEKLPLYAYDTVEQYLYLNAQPNVSLVGNDVFGTVSEKYVFKYSGEELEKITYYHASESHYGTREFKKGYVMKFERSDEPVPLLEGRILVNGIPTRSYDIFEFEDDQIVRYSYDTSGQNIARTTSHYTPQGRATYVSVPGQNNDCKYLSYDENGNVTRASLNYRGHPLDVGKEYNFTFEGDRLVALTYWEQNAWDTLEYTATLSYNDDGLFCGADIRFRSEQWTYTVAYDAKDRVSDIELLIPDYCTYSLGYTYAANGSFQQIAYEAASSYRDQMTSAEYVFTYDAKGNLTQITYPVAESSTRFHTETVQLTYSQDGKLLNDGVYAYTYYETGELKSRTALEKDDYILYYQNGKKQEERYTLSRYTVTDRFENSNLYHELETRDLYVQTERTVVQTGGNPFAASSTVITPDGGRYEIEKEFDDAHRITKRVVLEQDASGKPVRKTVTVYDPVFGDVVSTQTTEYDENGNPIT